MPRNRKRVQPLQQPKIMPGQSVAVLLVSIALILLISRSGMNEVIKWLAAIVTLALMSVVMIKINRFRNLFIFYLIGGKRGISFIESLSEISPRFWIAMADWGFVVSFGLLSLLFKRQVSKRMLAFGIVSSLLILNVVLPASISALNFLNIPQITSKIAFTGAQTSAPAITPTFVGVNLLTAACGFSVFITLALVGSAVSILYGIAVFLISVSSHVPNYGAISSQIPGIIPLIPGITLPLAAGIVAIAIMLIVHEFSHGVLARIAKVKVKEVGLLVLGFIPMGAYVEPDEAQMRKLPKEMQNRILVAGVASNILLGVISFALLMLVVGYVLPHFISTSLSISYLVPNSPAANVIPVGAQVLYWNNIKITNSSSLLAIQHSEKPLSTVSLVTNKGNYSVISNSTGKIGVGLSEITGPIKGSIESSAVYFIYIVLSLSLLLNLLAGIVNLLPAPSLDGWQIYNLRIKNKRITRVLALLVFLSLLVNVLPWLYAV
ncbi:MAG: site-2 protease family protein [Candidatus Micrarchaeota archaeon]|nr:site-2 protease family protein [Candidatus Micrarchaeota archaeon]